MSQISLSHREDYERLFRAGVACATLLMRSSSQVVGYINDTLEKTQFQLSCIKLIMDQVQVLADQIENLSLQLRDAVKCLKNLLEFKPDSWQGYTSVPLYKEQPSMQEIYERRQAALKHYRQQYELEHSDDDDDDIVFRPAAGEDVIDAKQPIESYYTTEYELASGITKETDDFMAEDEIDQQQQQLLQQQPVTRNNGLH